jgi:hypothetical protein
VYCRTLRSQQRSESVCAPFLQPSLCGSRAAGSNITRARDRFGFQNLMLSLHLRQRQHSRYPSVSNRTVLTFDQPKFTDHYAFTSAVTLGLRKAQHAPCFLRSARTEFFAHQSTTPRWQHQSRLNVGRENMLQAILNLISYSSALHDPDRKHSWFADGPQPASMWILQHKLASCTNWHLRAQPGCWPLRG